MGLLPEVKTAPNTDPNKMTYLLYGVSGIGKTTFCAGLPDALFLDTEKGTKLQNVYSIGIDSWEKFLQVVREITTTKHKFKSVVIDTVGNLITYCIRSCCNKFGITHPSDGEYGKAWDVIKNEFRNPINELNNSGYGVWFVAHEHTSTIKAALGGDYSFTEYDIPNFVKKIVVALCDYCFYATLDQKYEKVGEKTNLVNYRVIKTKPAKNYAAKDRTVKSPLPDVLPLDTAIVLDTLSKHLKINSEIASNVGGT